MATSLSQNNFGLIKDPKKIYKPYSDLFFVPFVSKRLYAQNTIPHFYMWDTHFAPIMSKDGYIKVLERAKEAGVKYICQTDFSVWHFQTEKQKDWAVKKNTECFTLDLQYNVQPFFNFNIVIEEYFQFYIEHYPKNLGAILIDFNHSAQSEGITTSEYVKRETRSMQFLVDNFDFELCFVFSGKKQVPTPWVPFFNLIKQKAKIVPIPTEMAVLHAMRKKYYPKR